MPYHPIWHSGTSREVTMRVRAACLFHVRARGWPGARPRRPLCSLKKAWMKVYLAKSSSAEPSEVRRG